jgi:hypothetical protein
MEPTQAKPVRKRRRWLIVAFIFVFVSLVSWWLWPRGDARFVGKWQMSNDQGTANFKSNGRVIWYNANGSVGLREQWWVADGQLHLKPEWFDGFSADMQTGFDVLLGRLPKPIRSYTFTDTPDGRVRLEWAVQPGISDTREMTRIPD